MRDHQQITRDLLGTHEESGFYSEHEEFGACSEYDEEPLDGFTHRGDILPAFCCIGAERQGNSQRETRGLEGTAFKDDRCYSLSVPCWE